MIKKQVLERWIVQDAVDLYTIRNWRAGYFDISSKGNVVVTPFPNNKKVAVDLARDRKAHPLHFGRGMRVPFRK